MEMDPSRDRADRFEGLVGKRYALLTTYRRDGTPVPTPVELYGVHEALFFITDARSGKAKRIRRDPHVTIAPCRMRGAPVGPTVHARVRVLPEDEAVLARGAFARRHRLSSRLGAWRYRRAGKQMIVCELLPANTSRLVA